MYKGIHCYGDFHAHTTYSGHAMSSPSEMVDGAIRKGFNYLALTDHVYQYELKTDIENQNARPRLMNIYLSNPQWPFYLCGGWEFNNFVDNPAINYQGLKLLGWHSWFGPDPNEVQFDKLLADYTTKVETHKFDILVHPERVASLFKIAWQQIDFLESICDLAQKHGCMIEFNTSSIRYTSCIPELADCSRLLNILLDRLHNFPSIQITIGSDAHVASDIGLNFDLALEMLDSAQLLDRVVNIDEACCTELYQKSLRGGGVNEWIF